MGLKNSSARINCALLIFVVAFLPTTVCQNFTKVISTDKGDVVGRYRISDTRSVPYAAYLGIPFARAPVGEWRFRDPVEPQPWTGVLKCITERPVCAQQVLALSYGDEDCLYLNVYSPVLDPVNTPKKLPVMVWIYGGAYMYGGGTDLMYGVGPIIEHNCVIVKCQYRLGALGFTYTDSEDAQGNQAYKDQRLCLQWVQRNIANFGGDPKTVTIFGESAGSVSVMNHILSAPSKGLFHRAIMQSGSVLCPWGHQSSASALNLSYKVARRVGCDPHNKEALLHCLKNADIADVQKASFTMISLFVLIFRYLPFTGITETTTTNSTFIDECPLKKLVSGNFTEVPMIIGYNKDEALLFQAAVDFVYRLVIMQVYRIEQPHIRRIADWVVTTIDPIAKFISKMAIKVSSFISFSGPIDNTVTHLTRFNKYPVYYYRLSYNSNYSLHRAYSQTLTGTAHTDDLNLLFQPVIQSNTDPENDHNVMQNKMVTMWTEFARTGNPTPDTSNIGVFWEPAGEEGLQLDIGNNVFTMGSRRMTAAERAYQELYINTVQIPFSCGESPVLHPPVVHPPVSHPPVVQPPVVHPPVVRPPVSHPPVVQPPVLHPPVVHPPVSHPPVVQPPVVHPPVVRPPVSHPPVVQPPVVHPPVVRPPVVRPPVVHPPVVNPVVRPSAVPPFNFTLPTIPKPFGRI